jgi:CxxC motif-containing protein (DUF1111 family)
MDGEAVAETAQALLGDALPGLTNAELTRFDEGKDAFEEIEDIADGVGPVFNERACGNCHNVAASGGAGVQFEVRAGNLTNGVFNPLTSQGGTLFDLFSVTSFPASERQSIPNCTLPPNGEPVPANANVVARRRTTALFGLGLVNATPDATFLALASSQASTVHGRAPLVDNIAAGHRTVGKFGWKDQNPTLVQFASDAYLNEMGITNPEFPVEQAPSGNAAKVGPCDGARVEPGAVENVDDIARFTDFMSFLAPPARGSGIPTSVAGDVVFSQIGCDTCHVRTLQSGTHPIAALSQKTYHPFSDFLLHDMGSLGDNIGGNGTAGLREMRTAPLWGLRFLDPSKLLHDGRGTSLADAILRHDGDAAASRDQFSQLPAPRKDHLIAFLRTL